MKHRKENRGFSLIILLIVVAIIALIFFAKGGALDRYKGSIGENKEQKKAAEEQLQDIQGNFDDYNKQIKKELNN
ncbi:MAG: hypothetical protein PHR36_00960 [Patescibacteria group bacterium]|nr:hypothetical protein [Patescibacteria group bacterium]